MVRIVNRQALMLAGRESNRNAGVNLYGFNRNWFIIWEIRESLNIK